MMTNSPNDISKKPGECDKESLSIIIEKAMSYADIDPETSLMHARKSAEAICSTIFALEIGNPKNTRLDKLIELLSQKEKLPEKIKIPLRVIQQYGNYGAHFQEDTHQIDRVYITPCLSALILVTNWYFHDYLNTEIPSIVAEANNSFESQVIPIQESYPTQAEIEEMSDELNLPFALRAYQWEGVNFLVQHKSALLADEMGLGKTVQTIIALRLLLRNSVSKRVLVITPSSLSYNWEHEINNWASDLVVRRVIGNQKDRLATYQLPIQILIASYEQIRMDALHVNSNIEFEAVILDEAPRIKNRHSRSALACRILGRSRAWALTGTPLENSIEDLVSLYSFLKPGLIDIGMPPTVLHERIKPYFLRRRKKDVLDELPPIIIKDVILELSSVQKTTYEDLWQSRHFHISEEGKSVSEVTLFSLITKLKQICNFVPSTKESIKYEALDVLVEDCTELDDKIIIFSQFVDTIKFISGKLSKFSHDVYTGELSQLEREKVLKNFRKQQGPRALLMSLRAGGYGLNIQEASTVVLFDRWWNPAIENQAIQRAHRFGRERPLYVVRFLVKDTIEERIADILRNKQIDFDTYIEKAESAPTKLLTRNELFNILEISQPNSE